MLLFALCIDVAEEADARGCGKQSSQRIQITALLTPGEILFVVPARLPGFDQNKILGVVLVCDNINALAPFESPRVTKNRGKNTGKFETLACLRGHFQKYSTAHIEYSVSYRWETRV